MVTKHTKGLIFILLTCLMLYSNKGAAQFYNGLNLTFGKNRVQYNDFKWQYLRFEKFDVYYNNGGKNLATVTGEIAFEKISTIENFFEAPLDKRIVFVVYNRLTDFRQSNIGLENVNEQNIGGINKVIGNKVFLYYEDDHINYEQQVSKSIANIVFDNMLYGGTLRDKVATSTMLNLPEWFTEGLLSYVSCDWDIEIEDHVKDGILSKEYKKLNWLTGDKARYAGHSIWQYIADTYGEQVIRNIIYLTKINRDFDKGFSFVIGASFKDIVPLWMDYYTQKYETDNTANYSSVPDSLSIRIGRRKKKQRVFQQLKISPDNKYIAYTTNEEGKSQVWIYDNEKRKHKKLLSQGQKLKQITDYSYPLLAWHPSGELLAIITETKGVIKLTNYYTNTGKFDYRAMSEKPRSTTTDNVELRRLFHFEKILDFSYSKSGLKLVLSAVKEGCTDIFVFNLTSNSSEQITTDVADDLTPHFTDEDTKIIFSSNRKSNELKKKEMDTKSYGTTYDLFVYDYKNRKQKLSRITNTPYTTEKKPIPLNKNTYFYTSDQNGILNRYTARFDSTISHIDTVMHYRYFTIKKPETNYNRNLRDYDFNPKTESKTELFFKDKKSHIYFNETGETDLLKTDSLTPTAFRKKYIATFAKQIEKEESERKKTIARLRKVDSLENVIAIQERELHIKDSISSIGRKHPDSILIDVNNYKFENELYKKKTTKSNAYLLLNYLKNQNIKDTFAIPKQRLYLTNFYTNYIINQVDYSFLSNSYQTFTGGPVYFNPGGNLLMKVETCDLFEDYKVVGGFRLAGSLNSFEYLLSFEDLKNRFDKQYVFHRQSFIEKYQDFVNNYTVTNQLFYNLRFPINQVSSLRSSTNIRYDRTVQKSLDPMSLIEKDKYRVWGGLKLEYVFDNTYKLGQNLYSGARFKIFGEFYNQLDSLKTDMFVLGADFRNYTRIHRNLIWANRLAMSTSFGHQRLLYYLGSLDNWVKSPTKIFDSSNPINNRQDYAFQTTATNMRGFKQNIRNGNSFMVLNSELRWPVFNYLFNRPINSELLNNFQIVAFADIGAAWSGKSPKDEQNAYNREVKRNGSITFIIDQEKPPFVFGYGVGVRSRLLGYFVRLDWAWGIEGDVILPRVFYLSLAMDF